MAKAISARREKLRSNKLKIFSRRHSLLCYRAMEGCGSKYPLKIITCSGNEPGKHTCSLTDPSSKHLFCASAKGKHKYILIPDLFATRYLFVAL